MAPRSTCPINGALELFGDKWTLLILRDMMFVGKRSFREFQSSAEGIATNILSARLAMLEDTGLIRKEPDPADGRRSLYLLTERGISLAPIMVELTLWGSEQLPGTDPQPNLRADLAADRNGAIAGLQSRLKDQARLPNA